jgi:serine O-acetyltransferase
MNDPVVKAIHGLLDHSVEVDARIRFVLTELKKLGVDLSDLEKPKDDFDADYLNRIVD